MSSRLARLTGGLLIIMAAAAGLMGLVIEGWLMWGLVTFGRDALRDESAVAVPVFAVIGLLLLGAAGGLAALARRLVRGRPS